MNNNRPTGTIPCECGSTDFKSVNTVTMDYYLVLEMELVCKKCGAQVNYWVTGYWQNPETWEDFYEMPEDLQNSFSYLLARIKNSKYAKETSSNT